MIVSNSQVIGCEDRLRNDLYCVGWGAKLDLLSPNRQHATAAYLACKQDRSV